MKTLLAILLLASTATAQDVVTDPAPDPEWQPPALFECGLGDNGGTRGTYASCSPVNDWFCGYRFCDVAPVSWPEVYHPDGQRWAAHWLACKSTLDLQEQRTVALEQAVEELTDAIVRLRALCGRKCRGK